MQRLDLHPPVPSLLYPPSASAALPCVEFLRTTLNRQRLSTKRGVTWTRGMGAAESTESEASGGIASQILKLKMAKSKGEMTEEEYDAGALPRRLSTLNYPRSFTKYQSADLPP